MTDVTAEVFPLKVDLVAKGVGVLCGLVETGGLRADAEDTTAAGGDLSGFVAGSAGMNDGGAFRDGLRKLDGVSLGVGTGVTARR